MRVRLLYRYVLGEFIPPFLVGLLVFTFVLILHHLFLMMDLFLNRGVELSLILRMVGLILPMFLPLSIPMACLLAALIAYGRLTEDNELTALKSGGCPLSLYSVPNLIFALVLSVGLVFFNLYVAPRSTQEFKDLHYAVAQKNPLALFSAKVMNHFGEYNIIVDEMDRRRKLLKNISIYRMNPSGPPTRILAPEGKLRNLRDGSVMLELKNGALHQPNANKESEYTITKFNRFSLRIPTRDESGPPQITPREMDFTQLRAKLKEAAARHLSTAPYTTESNLRIAIAFAPAVFVMLGTALGILFRKGSKSVGIGISVVVILVYYGLFLLSVNLSSRGVLPPVLLTWIPNLIALSAGAAIWRELARQ